MRQELENVFVNLDPQYGNYLASTIMSLENGPDVLYYLATNPDVAEKLVNSGPLAATVGLGRIEASIMAETEKKTKKVKVSDAPSPPPQVTRGTGTKIDIPDDTDDLDAFAEKFFKRR